MFVDLGKVWSNCIGCQYLVSTTTLEEDELTIPFLETGWSGLEPISAAGAPVLTGSLKISDAVMLEDG